MAKLYFRYGSMNCGKSTSLMQVAHNYKERGLTSIIIKPYTDTKGGNNVVSRLGVSREVDLLLSHDKNIFNEVFNWIKNNGELNCILVD